MERLSTGNNRQTITTSSLSDHAFFPDPEVTANCWQMMRFTLGRQMTCNAVVARQAKWYKDIEWDCGDVYAIYKKKMGFDFNSNLGPSSGGGLALHRVTEE